MNHERAPIEEVRVPLEPWQHAVESALTDAALRIEHALRKVLPDIRAGMYGVVVGIDASGRIPALLTWQVLNKYHNVPLRFLAGRGQWSGSPEEEQRHADDRRNYFDDEFFLAVAAHNKKILIVDDTVATGGSIKATCDALTSHKIPFDVVTAGGFVFEDIPAEEQSQADRLGANRVVIGSGGLPDVYGNKRLSGVQKRQGARHAVPFDRDPYDRAPLDPHDAEVQRTARTVAYTRDRLHDYSDQIFQRLESGEQTN